MTRPRHPKPEVEEALRYAESRGCHVDIASGHPRGRIVCPGCPLIWVWSTPKNAGNHARDLRHKVDRCWE